MFVVIVLIFINGLFLFVSFAAAKDQSITDLFVFYRLVVFQLLAIINVIQTIQFLREKIPFVSFAFRFNLLFICFGFLIHFTYQKMPDLPDILMLFVYPLGNFLPALVLWNDREKAPPWERRRW